MCDWEDFSGVPKDGTTVDIWIKCYDQVTGMPSGHRVENCAFRNGQWHSGAYLVGWIGTPSHYRRIETPKLIREIASPIERDN